MSQDFRLTETERAQMDRDGFVVRESTFSAAECDEIAGAVEQLVADLTATKRGKKQAVGSYMFEWQNDLASFVKWEPEHPDVVQGVEPFAHISRPLAAWASDPRFVEPSRDFVGQDDISLFTEKLTMKRAHTGGLIVLHQDYPYWKDVTPVADRTMTAMLYLDAATVENGCLEVAPGSHRDGEGARRADDGFGRNEMDPERFDLASLVPVEAPAGSVVFFGSFLVHRSLLNRSPKDRRALLYSYQPSGHPSLSDMQREARRAAAK